MDQDVGGLKKWWIRTDYESGRGQGLSERDYYTGGRERAMKHLI